MISKVYDNVYEFLTTSMRCLRMDAYLTTWMTLFFFGFLFYGGFMSFINYVYVSSAFIGLRFGLLGFLKMKKTYGEEQISSRCRSISGMFEVSAAMASRFERS
jgi:hypothetical protein